MTMLSITACSASLGRPVARLAAWAASLGLVAFVAGLLLGRAGPAFAALTASWLFFAGLAVGGVALSNAIHVARGRWAGRVLPLMHSSTGFFIPAWILLMVIVIAGRGLRPWALAPGDKSMAVVAVGDLVAAAVLFTAGWISVERARAPSGPGAAAPIYLLLYVAVLSLWAYDLIMGITRWSPSTVIPAYYFAGAFLSAVAWSGFVVALRGTGDSNLRHDLGKLVFALIIFWSYLLWSAFLPTWYENVPEETGQLMARWRGAYLPVTAAVLIAVFAWPFWLLFSEKLKRHRASLALGTGVVLSGLFAERFLLILPSLRLSGDIGSFLVGTGVTAGMLGLFILSVGSRLTAIEGAPELQAQAAAATHGGEAPPLR